MLMDNFKFSLVQHPAYIYKKKIDQTPWLYTYRWKKWKIFSTIHFPATVICCDVQDDDRISINIVDQFPIVQHATEPVSSHFIVDLRFTDTVGDTENNFQVKKKREREREGERTRATNKSFVRQFYRRRIVNEKRRDTLEVDRSMIVSEGSRRERELLREMVYQLWYERKK